jgi:hypothetical protein
MASAHRSPRPSREVWFAIPSANPEKCRKVLPVWRERGYKIAVLQNFERGEIPADVTVWRDAYPGWPESVNILCREIVPKSCDLVVSGGDDMLPDPNHTAQELADQFFERFPDGFGVMQPHGDEFLSARRYCGSPFIGRAWFESMYGGAGPMYGRYHHNYADNEMYWVAKGLGALWERPDLSHYHDHFTRTGQAQPAYWESVKRKDLPDCLLYYARVHEYFPGHAPANLPKDVAPVRAYDTSMPRDQMLALAEQRLFRVAIDNPYADAIQKALVACRDAGQDPEAIYGFGLHTQVAGSALREPPVKVVCIIDDNESNHGRVAWGIPVVSRESALRMGVRAVILSGNSVEDALWSNAAIFRERGIEVRRLYGSTQAGASALTATELVHA